MQVSMAGAVVTDSRNTSTQTLNNLVNTSSSINFNTTSYRLTVDFGTGNEKEINIIQLDTLASADTDSVVQAKDGLVISASDDGVTWIPLFISDQPAAAGRRYVRSLNIAPDKPYRYYQIEIGNQFSVSCTLYSVRLFEPSTTGSISCLLPKCPYLNSPIQWQPPVTITSGQQPSAEVWKAFDHSLTLNGFAGRFTAGLYAAGNTLATHTGDINPHALENLECFPTVEVSFDMPHRIRSWSLQSVGDKNYEITETVFESFATVLVLQGRTLDGTWHILNLARTQNSNDDWSGISELCTAAKIRVDHPVQHIELVDAIRISAVAVQILYGSNVLYGGFVWFPQIQVFAGVPVIRC
jgi:hypothetical protein